MKVTEDDRNRQVDDIGRVAPKQANQLDDFGESKYKDDLGPDQALSRL